MDYDVRCEFTCECGRTHKLRFTREGMERTTRQVPDVIRPFGASRWEDVFRSEPRTIQPTNPGPDTIRGS